MERALRRVDRALELPRWSWLPVAMGLGVLLLAAVGFYWDVNWHIELGRDKELFTPPHDLILLGLTGVGVCGLVAQTLYAQAGRRDGIRVLRWTLAPGAAFLMLCSAFAVAAFPLDDLWHAFFGQDVTLWGPTHILMISGAALSPVGFGMLLAQGREEAGGPLQRRRWLLGTYVAGAMLVGVSAYQAEFDFGVPQFQLLYQPVLIAVAAGLVLTAARIALGPGGALAAAVTFLLIRGFLDLFLLLAGRGPARFPLYLVEAALVEGAALLWRRRPLAAAVAGGLGIGTVGLLAEAGWMEVWGTHPWSAHVLRTGLVVGTLGAVSGAVVAAWIGSRLRPVPRPLRLSFAAVAAVGITVAAAFPFPRTEGTPPAASVRLEPRSVVDGEREARVRLRVALRPPDAARGADWFEALAWQGGDQVIEPLVPDGSGGFRTEDAVPIGGTWKTEVRLARGSQTVALPVSLPAVPETGARAIRPEPAFRRAFVFDPKLLLREETGGPAWLVAAGYSVVAAIGALWIVGMAFTQTRLRRMLPKAA